MNANRLINMILRMVMRKGAAHLSKGQSGPHVKNANAAAKRARQAARLTRRM